jgi:ferrous iron transport protein A
LGLFPARHTAEFENRFQSARVASDASMNLAQTRIGQVVTVTHIAGEGSFRRRLMELGLVPGTRVEVVGVAPLGDPLELLVRGGSLSIRRAEAEGVSVSFGEASSAERAPETAGRTPSSGALAPRGLARSAP